MFYFVVFKIPVTELRLLHYIVDMWLSHIADNLATLANIFFKTWQHCTVKKFLVRNETYQLVRKWKKIHQLSRILTFEWDICVSDYSFMIAGSY